MMYTMVVVLVFPKLVIAKANSADQTVLSRSLLLAIPISPMYVIDIQLHV